LSLPPRESSYYVVFNARSGTAQALGVTADTLPQSMERNGLRFTIDADDQSAFEERISRALASEHDVVVAAGGDGTASGLPAPWLAATRLWR